MLHPLQDDLILHIRQEANCTLKGITRAGQRYIEQLKLNRQPLVLHRQSQVREEQIAERLDVIGARVDQILKRIQVIDKSRQRGA